MREIFIELRLFRQDLQAMPFDRRRAVRWKCPAPPKTAPVTLPFTSPKNESAARESERSRIPLEHQIRDRHSRSARQQIAELVINGVSVGRGGKGGYLGDMESQEDNNGKRAADAGTQVANPCY